MEVLHIDYYQAELMVDLALRVVGVVWAATLLTVILLRVTK